MFDLAKAHHARVILSGDRYQHGSVEQGGALRLLEVEAGIRSAALTEIVHQKDRYKQAVTHLSQGRAESGFRVLSDLKWIHEMADPAASRELFYVSVSRGRSQRSVYTDDQLGLLEAISHPSDRLSATELMSHGPNNIHERIRRNLIEQTLTPFQTRQAARRAATSGRSC